MRRVGAISSIVGNLLTPSRTNCEIVQFQGQSLIQAPRQSNLRATVLSPQSLENLFNFDRLECGMPDPVACDTNFRNDSSVWAENLFRFRISYCEGRMGIHRGRCRRPPRALNRSAPDGRSAPGRRVGRAPKDSADRSAHSRSATASEAVNARSFASSSARAIGLEPSTVATRITRAGCDRRNGD